MRVVNSLGQVLVLTGAGAGGGTTFSAGLSTLGNTAGNTGTVSNQVVFAGINGITLSGSTVGGGSATITISGITQSLQPAVNALGVSDTGNTAGNTGTSSGITWVLAGSNALTLSQSTAGGGPNTVWVQGPLSATTISAVSAGNVIGTRGSRFALEDHQHAGVFSAGVSNVGVTAGNTTVVPGRFVFAGSGGVTVSQETAANSLNTLHVQGPVSATTISGVQSVNSIGTRGTRFALEDHFHQGVAQFQISGNTSNTSNVVVGSLVLAGGNNVTLSQVSAAGAATVTISAAAQTNQQMTMFATGNTTQSSTGTTNASSMIFRGSGAASVGITNGSVLIDVAAGAAAITQSIGISTETAGGATAGTSGYATGDDILYHFVPGSNITMSQSLNGASATLSIYGPAAGGGATASSYLNAPYWLNTQTQTLSNSLSYALPFMVNDNAISFNYARRQWSVSVVSTSFASTANTSYSYNLAQTHNLVLYTKMTGASSVSLGSIASTSVGFTHSIRLSRNTTNNISVTHGYTFPSHLGTETTSFSYAATNSSDQFSTTGAMTVMTGVKNWLTSFAFSLSQGMYYLIEGYSSTQTTQQTAALSNHRMQMSRLVMTQANLAVAPFASAAAAAFYPVYFGPGSFSTAGGATTSILPIANLSSSASHGVPWLALEMIV